ncbi:HAD family hydrolase [Catellatospora coxensis]|nr:HAD family hydrolase [Catellatospora coxensis]
MTDTAAAVPLLVLWDVDDTLIYNGGVSKEAYALGFKLLTGKSPVEKVITDGMTDTGIMRSLFERHGLVLTPELAAQAHEVMPTALGSLVPQLRERGHAMPGARAAIDALGEEAGITQSVLTGNIAPNAYTKVATFGLHSGLDFEVGGYGSDHEVRAELVPAARAKAARKYGIEFTPATTVLIGDTPRDVEAGRVGGAYVVAVATGKFDAETLAGLGADVVLPDLRDTARLVEAVLSVRGLLDAR